VRSWREDRAQETNRSRIPPGVSVAKVGGMLEKSVSEEEIDHGAETECGGLCAVDGAVF
jgi:hypothetical protein